MANTETSPEAGALSVALFTELTAGLDVTLPEVDLTGPDFQIPGTAGNPLYDPVAPLTEADLTSRAINGSGMFDGLMQVIGLHLEQEFKKNRITGAQYAEAYVGIVNGAMSSAVTYLLQKDSARWQAVLVQQQARAAEIAVVNARVALEETKVRLQIAHLQAKLEASNYALSKMKLANEDATWFLTKAQIAQTKYQTTTLMPAQKLGIDMDTAMKTAQRDQVLYETASILPAQKAKLDTEEDVLRYQLTAVYPAQVAGYTADTAGKTYTNNFLLPAQLDSLKEQTEAHRAKTLNTRTNGTVVAGAMGKQNELLNQQIESFQRDGELKFLKTFMDAWITQKTTDGDTATPTSMINTKIDTMVATMRTRLDLGA